MAVCAQRKKPCRRAVRACGGKLSVIACIEDPPLIAKILGHVSQREALIGNTPRSPPMLQPQLTLTQSGWVEAQGIFRLLAWLLG